MDDNETKIARLMEIKNQINKGDDLSATGYMAAKRLATGMLFEDDIFKDIRQLTKQADQFSMKGSDSYKLAIKSYNAAIKLFNDLSIKLPIMENDMYVAELGMIYLKLARAYMGATAYMRDGSKRLINPHVLDMYTQSELLYEKAIQVSEANNGGLDKDVYHYFIGSVQMLKGDNHNAIQNLAKSVDNPVNTDSVSMSKRLWRLYEAYQSANSSVPEKSYHIEKTLKKIIENDQHDFEAHKCLGDMYRGSFLFSQAIEHYQSAHNQCAMSSWADTESKSNMLKQIDRSIKACKIAMGTIDIQKPNTANQDDGTLKQLPTTPHPAP
jgi:tetratricopeptide (TPR) repeat protein